MGYSKQGSFLLSEGTQHPCGIVAHNCLKVQLQERSPKPLPSADTCTQVHISSHRTTCTYIIKYNKNKSRYKGLRLTLQCGLLEAFWSHHPVTLKAIKRQHLSTPFPFNTQLATRPHLLLCWISLILAYLNNLPFSTMSEPLTVTISSQINLEMIVSAQLNDRVATGNQTNFLE